MDVALSAVLTSLHQSCDADNHYEVTRQFQNNTLIRNNLTIFTLPTFPNCPECVTIALKYLPEEQITCKAALDRNALIAALVLGESQRLAKTISALCEHNDGLLVHEIDALGRSPIHYAVIRGDLEILQIVAAKGPNFKLADNDGNTILHQFFHFDVRNLDLLKYLLNEFPEVRELIHQPNNLEKGQNTPAMLAIRLNYDDIGVEMMKTSLGKAPESEFDNITHILSNLQRVEKQEDVDLFEKIVLKFGSMNIRGNTLLHLVADSGLTSPKIITFCLDEPGALRGFVQLKNSDNETPLHVAIKSKNRAMVQGLLKFEPDLDMLVAPQILNDAEIFLDIYEKYPSILTLSKDDTCILGYLIEGDQSGILEKLAPLSKLQLNNGMTMLHILAKHCKSDTMVEFFSKHDLNEFVNVQDKEGRTPLIAAMEAGNSLMYHRILDHLEPNLKVECHGVNALHIAIRREQIPFAFIVKLLIWDPELANVSTKMEQDSPLMLAIIAKRFDLVEYLRRLNVKLEVASKEDNTAMHYLALYQVKDAKIVNLLLDGVDAVPLLNRSNMYGQTPVEIAAAKGNAELVSAFSKYLVLNVEPKSVLVNGTDELNFKEEMNQIFETNDLPRLKERLAAAPPRQWEGESPLHLVTCYPQVSPEILEYLLENVDINGQNLLGDTPLHLAALRAHLPLLTMLLPLVDLYRKNYKQETALLAALNTEWNNINLDVIHIMLKHAPLLAMIPGGINGEVTLETDRKGSIERPIMAEKDTPLEVAVRRSLFDVVKMLVELGKVEINYVTLEGNIILHHLASYPEQDERIMQYLLFQCKTFRYVNKSNKMGNTPLHLAAKNNNLKYVQRLLSLKKTEVKVMNAMKETPLFLALASNGATTNPAIVQTLVTRYPGAVNIANHIGDMPINIALNTGSPELVKILVESGKIKFDKWRDRQKNTLLHFIGLYSIQDRFLCTYLISKAGPKVINEKNVLGQTILHYMCRDDHTCLKSLLDHPNIDVTVLNSNLDPPLMDYLKPERDFSNDILSALMNKVATCNANRDGETPLKRALDLYEVRDPVVVNSANANTKKPLIVMVQKGSIDFSFADNDGNSVLHILAKLVRDEEVIRLFLGKCINESKMDLNQQLERRNKDEKTALDVARFYKNDTFLDVVELS